MIKMFNKIPEHKSNNLLKNHENDMGFDIRSGEAMVVFPGRSHVFKTGLHLCVPPIMGGIIQSRSGLAIKYDVEVSNAGVIDSGYRGEINIKVYNQGLNDPYKVNIGDRIAQMVFHIRPEEFFNLVDGHGTGLPGGGFSITESSMETWPKSDRKDSGIGSSGVK